MLSEGAGGYATDDVTHEAQVAQVVSVDAFQGYRTSAAVAVELLPPGWVSKMEQATGRTFYVNHDLKAVSWDRQGCFVHASAAPSARAPSSNSSSSTSTSLPSHPSASRMVAPGLLNRDARIGNSLDAGFYKEEELQRTAMAKHAIAQRASSVERKHVEPAKPSLRTSFDASRLVVLEVYMRNNKTDGMHVYTIYMMHTIYMHSCIVDLTCLGLTYATLFFSTPLFHLP